MCVCSAEAADQLGTNGKLVERLVEWCEAKDHAGVMGESNRLLSALIRHSKSKVRRHSSHTNYIKLVTSLVAVNCSLVLSVVGGVFLICYFERFLIPAAHY